MLLVIHNIPAHMRHPDIKQLIKDKCGLTELILDDLLNEGQCKRVTVGLADEGDAALLVRKINGLLFHGSQLYVEDLRQKKGSDQPYFRNKPTDDNQQSNMQQTPQFQGSNMMQYSEDISSLPPPMLPTQMPYNNLPFYMSPVQNTSISYDKQTSLPTNPLQQVPYYQQDMSSYGYQQPNLQNQWNEQLITSYPEKPRPVMPPDNASNVTDSYVPNMDKKGVDGNGPRNYQTFEESNWRDNRDKSGPSSSHNEIPNRGRNPYKLDNRKNRSGTNFDQQEDRQRRYDQSPPRGNEGHGNKPIPKRNNDFENPHRSRFDRSPPRDRNLPHDRFRGRSGRESGFDESDEQCDFDRDNFRDIDEYDQRRSYDRKNDGQYNFGMKRQRPNSKKPPKTFSNDHTNFTFLKPKVNFYGQKAASKRFNTQSNETDVRGPPAKFARFRKEGKNVHALGFGQHPDSKFIDNESEIMKNKLMTHNNFRNKAIGQLAKQIMTNARVPKIKNYKKVLKSLHKCIMSRIDVILGDRIATSFEEIMDSYRNEYNIQDDLHFFAAVVEKLERDKEDSALQAPGPGKPPKGQNNTANSVQPSTSVAFDPSKSNYYKKLMAKQALGKDPQQNAQNAPGDQDSRLPRYPNASKDVFKELKRTTKMEYQKDIYSIDQTLQKALKAELIDLKKMFVLGCGKPSDPNEKNMRHRLITETVQEFLKVTQMHLKKRLLNIHDNLVIRIFCSPKPPRREAMDAALKEMGIESLRKSDKKKMFLATCNSFESYDRILAQQTILVDDLTLHFKPLHLVGPPIKKKSKEEKELKTEMRTLIEVDLDNEEDSDGLELDDNDDNDVNPSEPENIPKKSDKKPDASQNKSDGGQNKSDGGQNKSDGGQNKSDGDQNKSDGGQNKSDEGHDKPDESHNSDKNYDEADVLNDTDVVFVENKCDVMVIDDNEQFADDVDIPVNIVTSKETVSNAINFDDSPVNNDKITEQAKNLDSKGTIGTDEQNSEKTDAVAEEQNEIPEIVATDIVEDDLEDF